jgi:MraZ protein
MLIGEHTHTIDSKNRLSLPAKFRKEMGNTIVIAPGIDNCLFVFTLKGWKEFADRLTRGDSSSVLQTDNRNFNRLIIGRAVEVEVDAMGRMLVPEHLKTYASLKENASIIGVLNRVEIWDTGSWERYRDEYAKQTNALAEKLASTGLI